MLSPHNNDGIVVYLMGLILLVLVGVGATMLLDQIKPPGRQQAELKIQRETIMNLKAALTQVEVKRHALDGRERLKQDQIAGIVAQEQILHDRATAAGAEKHKLERAIAAIEAEFSDFKKAAQLRLRARSVGRHLGDLATNSGRVYRSAVIREVTDRGLKIIFENGFTSIAANDLPESFHEKYQWDTASPRRSVTVNVAAPAVGQRSPGTGLKLNSEEMSASLASARTKLGEAAALRKSLESQLRDLERGAAGSRSRSVPGSLDTWSDRMSQVRAELTMAEASYLKARVELAQLAPNDSLLQMWQDIP